MRLSRKSLGSSRQRQRRPVDPAVSQGSSGFAYRSRRSDEEIKTGRELSRETTKTKHLGRFLLKRFGLVVLLAALLISTINALTLSNNVRVMSLTEDSGNSFLHDQSVYEASASKLMAASIWNKNKITVNTAGVSQGMLKEFPELSSVSVTLPLLSKRPIVYIQTAQPALILTAQNGSFVVDTTGKALLPADKLPTGSNLKLPTVTDQGSLNVSVSHQALTSGNVGFIQTVIAQLAARNFTVESMTLPVGTSELDVKLAGQPYSIKFNLESGTAREQAGTFLATQSKLKGQNITPAQYVDVRVDGRAYYK